MITWQFGFYYLILRMEFVRKGSVLNIRVKKKRYARLVVGNVGTFQRVQGKYDGLHAYAWSCYYCFFTQGLPTTSDERSGKYNRATLLL